MTKHVVSGYGIQNGLSLRIICLSFFSGTKIIKKSSIVVHYSTFLFKKATVKFMNADEIIEVLLSEFQTDKAGLANLLGVHKSTISNITKGYTKKISANLAQRIMDIRPNLNYDFLLGNSNQVSLTSEVSTVSDQIYLTTKGKSRLSIAEVANFIINNIEAFEKNDIFKVYRESVENQAKVELLKEQLLLKNSVSGEN